MYVTLLTQNICCIVPGYNGFKRVAFLCKGRFENKRFTVVSRIDSNGNHRLISKIGNALHNASCAASDPIHTEIRFS